MGGRQGIVRTCLYYTIKTSSILNIVAGHKTQVKKLTQKEKDVSLHVKSAFFSSQIP